MSRDSWPPLLRGLGTTILVFGAIIAFVEARQDVAIERAKRQSAYQRFETNRPAVGDLKVLAQEVEELKSEVEAPNIAEEVVGNRWFEWMGIVGSCVLSSSFYVEAFIRRSTRT